MHAHKLHTHTTHTNDTIALVYIVNDGNVKYMYRHVNIHTCMADVVRMCVHVCICLCMCVQHVCMCIVCMCVVCMCVYMFMCVYVCMCDCVQCWLSWALLSWNESC